MKIDAMHLSPLVLLIICAGCGSGPQALPYPAFVAVDELANVFIAGLPGVRAKQLAGDPRSRRTSNRVQLPANWQFTTGASPTQSVEIYVLGGQLKIGEFLLTAGGYAYLPSGSSGSQMRTEGGAQILYFLDVANDDAVIQTPLLANSELLNWQPTGVGYATKELRFDPGSGARTWLLRVDAGALKGWQRSTQTQEGYLLSGALTESECNGEQRVTADYAAGGYFYRPSGSISGGPDFATSGGAVWFLRIGGPETISAVSGCVDSLP